MNPPKQTPKPPAPPEKKYLEIKPEDLAKVSKAREADGKKVFVDAEWLAIAEFGKHYGWHAIRAVLDNEIDIETMGVLLAGARKFDTARLYDNTVASFIGGVSAQAKKPTKTFKDSTKDIIKGTKADA